jgi:hypothetical protein
LFDVFRSSFTTSIKETFAFNKCKYIFYLNLLELMLHLGTKIGLQTITRDLLQSMNHVLSVDQVASLLQQIQQLGHISAPIIQAFSGFLGLSERDDSLRAINFSISTSSRHKIGQAQLSFLKTRDVQ